MSGPQRFRKKPVEVEAIRFVKPYRAVVDFCPVIQLVKVRAPSTRVAFAMIETSGGPVRAELGDWIIRGVRGEFWPCKPEVFAQTYDEVTP